MKKLISIQGPTAIGKTSIAIKLAQELDCEIISCDSRQFFREMKIGTASPSDEELAMVKHHFIGHKSVLEEYSAGDFERDVLVLLEQIYKKNDVAIMVGGSGMYANAIFYGLDNFPKIKKGLREELSNKSIDYLREKLQKLDLECYQNIDLNNKRRLIRALEICISSGEKYSSFKTKKNKKRNFEIIKIGLELPREILYDRINKRVDIMMEEGLLNEVKLLIEKKDLNPLNTIGYKELFYYLDKGISLEFAISEIKKNSRRYAKRQITWLRKDSDLKLFAPNDFEEINRFVQK